MTDVSGETGWGRRHAKRTNNWGARVSWGSCIRARVQKGRRNCNDEVLVFSHSLYYFAHAYLLLCQKEKKIQHLISRHLWFTSRERSSLYCVVYVWRNWMPSRREGRLLAVQLMLSLRWSISRSRQSKEESGESAEYCLGFSPSDHHWMQVVLLLLWLWLWLFLNDESERCERAHDRHFRMLQHRIHI